MSKVIVILNMWYLISGYILSSVVFILISKLFLNFSVLNLELNEKIIGWFLIDHIFEEYAFTSGKFFLINEDYRSLITNIIILIRNLCFFAQLFSPIEFITINILLIIIFFLVTSRHWKHRVKLFVFVSYIFLLQTFLIVNTYLLIHLFNLIVINAILIFSYYFYIYLISLLLIYNCSKDSAKQIYFVLIIKILVYFVVMFVGLLILFLVLFINCDSVNNFFLEFFLKLLIPYTYIFSTI